MSRSASRSPQASTTLPTLTSTHTHTHTHTPGFCWLPSFSLSLFLLRESSPSDPTCPFSFPFEEMSLEKETIGGFSPRKLQDKQKGLICKRTYRRAIVFKPLLGPCTSQGCLSHHMPPPAPNPSASTLSAAELGLAPFWETTVFLAGRERGVRPPCLALVQLGGWAYLLLLTLTLPLALERPRQKLC